MLRGGIDIAPAADYHAFSGPQVKQKGTIAILGGGVAGLAAGAMARGLGLPFRIFEKTGRTGGNCRTFRHGEFRFDSGAHRFHDQDAAATGQVRRLLKDRVRRVDVPSLIRFREASLTFPFTVGDLAARLGWPFLFKAAREVMAARWCRESGDPDFASRQTRKYGPTLARMFLLNYSEKLWGMPGERLSVETSGKRLQGLSLLTLLKETFFPPGDSSAHLEGAFYYPQGGIGDISDALADDCGEGHIHTGTEVTRVHHDCRRIHAVEVGHGETIPCSALVSTLPLDRFLRLLDPPPPVDVLAASEFRYRQLALVAFFLGRETVTSAATVYFPERRFPFTRVYEPRNRSLRMAPLGKTSLVAEIPYFAGEALERMADERLIETARSALVEAGLIREREVDDACVRRLADAYPLLEKGVEDKRRKIFSYLDNFSNLKIIGRNGTFRYLHIHDLLPEAARAVKELRLEEMA
jgi:protoporphyrinogen oxidase